MAKRSVTQLDVHGQRVLCRVDFNVPLAGSQVQDDTRIRAALPTIEWLRKHGARIILCTHLGRPKGEARDDLRLAPVARRLSDHLDAQVKPLASVTGEEVTKAVESMSNGDVVLLENLRFDPREEANDQTFARELAALADLYVNDAFGAAHRAHASTEGVAHQLPSAIGLLMQAELDALGRLLDNPERPFVAIIGGAKVSDKIKVLHNLLPRVDTLLIGGGMANTFLLAQGKAVGASLVEPDLIDVARKLLEQASDVDVQILLPVDVVTAPSIDAASGKVRPVDSVGGDDMILDIGPETARSWSDTIDATKTVFWNGPLGVAENPAFANGTADIAEAVARASGYTVIGGGESVAAIERLGLADRIDHISTGGGASLELLEGADLPGLAAIPEDA